MPGLPTPIRPSYRRQGGHCVARPSCHSDRARDREERITWSCATKRPVSGLLRAASPTIFLGAGEVRRAGIEGLETRREISSLPGPSSAKFGFRGGRMLHNSDKEFSLTMGGGCGMLEGGRHGAGERYKEPEGGREADSPTTYPNELIRIYKD